MLGALSEDIKFENLTNNEKVLIVNGKDESRIIEAKPLDIVSRRQQEIRALVEVVDSATVGVDYFSTLVVDMDGAGKPGGKIELRG